MGKKGSRRGGSPNSLGNNEHSAKSPWSRENHTFQGGSTVFIFFHFLYFISFSFIFFHFLSCSFMFFHFLSFSFIFFHFLSFSFIFFYFLSFLLVLLFFLGCSKSFFLHRFPYDFLLKLLCKNHFFRPSRGVPHWASLFSHVYFCIFFHFRFLFQFLSMFFLFFFCFHSFIFYSVTFLFLFPSKKVSSFFILFLFFFFSGAQNLWRHSRFLGEKCTF